MQNLVYTTRPERRKQLVVMAEALTTEANWSGQRTIHLRRRSDEFHS